MKACSFIIIFFLSFLFREGLAKTTQDSLSHQSCFLTRDSVLSLRSEKGFIPSFCANMKEQFLAPFHMNKKQLGLFAGGVAITYLLIKNDQAIDHNYFRYVKSRSELAEEVSPRVTMLGESYAAYFLIGYAGYSFVSKDHIAWRTSLLATQACLSAGLWVRLGKMLTSRERPIISYKTDKTKSVASFDAFPSGHTSAAFSIATVFAMQYSDTKAVPIIAYTVASLVGISRLTEHEHWASDVFVGGCIGYLCGRQVVLHERRLFNSTDSPTASQKRKPIWTFGLSDSANGLALSMKW
jgi:hypothetical protein